MRGESADVKALADDHLESGVPDGAELLAFAEAIVTGARSLPRARAAVVEALGSRAMVDAAGVTQEQLRHAMKCRAGPEMAPCCGSKAWSQWCRGTANLRP